MPASLCALESECGRSRDARGQHAYSPSPRAVLAAPLLARTWKVRTQMNDQQQSALWVWDIPPQPLRLCEFAQFIVAPMVDHYEAKWREQRRLLLAALKSKSPAKIGAQLRIKLPESYTVQV